MYDEGVKNHVWHSFNGEEYTHTSPVFDRTPNPLQYAIQDDYPTTHQTVFTSPVVEEHRIFSFSPPTQSTRSVETEKIQILDGPKEPREERYALPTWFEEEKELYIPKTLFPNSNFPDP